ncbi:acyltransferase [Niveibacterium sp. SC-1]|uniref:acyltransferase family protein n=1 Tax=Niveibacterium sp. SC-1 TaxID=3135646 RepID=UPI00311DEC75
MQKSIAGADGVRALACLMVLGHHLGQRLNPLPLSESLQAADFFLWSLSSGVAVFFVLSGMLLSRPFWDAWLDGRPMPSLTTYFVRRAARIVPAFYVAMLILFAVQLWLVPGDQLQAPVLRLVAGLAFVSGFHWLTWFPNELNGPFWSIGLEVFCYAVLPLFLLPLFTLLRRRSFASGIAWWLVGFGLVLLANAAVMALVQVPSEGRGWRFGLVGGAKYWIPNYNPVGFFAQYAFGVLAAGFIAWMPRSAACARLARSGLFDLLALAAIGLGLWPHLKWLALVAETQQMADFTFSWQNQPYFFPWFPASVALLLVSASASRWIGRVLDNPLFRGIARLSFGIYLWHFAVLEILQRTVEPGLRVFGTLSLEQWFGYATLVIALSTAIAALSWWLVEAPALRAVKRWESRRRGSGVPAAAHA